MNKNIQKTGLNYSWEEKLTMKFNKQSIKKIFRDTVSRTPLFVRKTFTIQ